MPSVGFKPLGIKNYGHIPHLPGSRVGPGDHHCNEGQARIATIKPRDSRDKIYISEKLDGANVGVCKVDGEIIALTRSGLAAKHSLHKVHTVFAYWVERHKKRFDAILQDRERICGEWILQAHGTRYYLDSEPFYVFDFFTSGNTRLPYEELRYWSAKGGFNMPKLLKDQVCSVEGVMYELDNEGEAIFSESAGKIFKHGFHYALEPAEGAVWRIERNGKFDFMCKFVRPGKIDGKYLRDAAGDPLEVMNENWQAWI